MSERKSAVISIAFARRDLQRVHEAAEREGMKVSTFIREASLRRLRRLPGSYVIEMSGGRARVRWSFEGGTFAWGVVRDVQQVSGAPGCRLLLDETF